MIGGKTYLDCKDDTEIYEHVLKVGDRIIAATDGVWDGVSFDNVKSMMKCPSGLAEIGRNIRESGYRGNLKSDDITIVLSEVVAA